MGNVSIQTQQSSIHYQQSVSVRSERVAPPEERIGYIPTEMPGDRGPAPPFTQDMLHIRTPDSGANMTKKLVGGAVLGASLMGMAQPAARFIATNAVKSPSLLALGTGAALGAGIALASLETGNAASNTSKNLAAGILIGGAVAGTAAAVGNFIFHNSLKNPTPMTLAIGASLGASIAMLSSQE